MIPLFVECTGKQVVIFGGGGGSGTQGRAFRTRGGSPHGQQDVFPVQPGAAGPIQTLDTRTATDAELDLIIAPAFLVIGALYDREQNRPDRGALQRAWRALQQRGRRARRRGHPGDDDGRALHDRDQHREREPGGVPVHPAGDREKLPVARCDDRAPAPLKGCARGRKTNPEERRRVFSAVLRDKTVWSLLPELARRVRGNG